MRLHSPATRTQYSVVKELGRRPLTISVQIVFDFNGADGHRTHDPRLAKPVLSQLSYSPTQWA
jgi:hypothetical protein